MKKENCKSNDVTTEQRIKIERLLLLPILDALVPNHKLNPAKFNIPNYELVGIITTEIKLLRERVYNQKKTIVKLRKKIESALQLDLLDLLDRAIKEEKQKV